MPYGGGVVARFGADTTGFMGGLNQMSSGLREFTSHFGVIGSLVGGFASGVTGAITGVGRGISGILDMTVGSIFRFGRGIIDLGTSMGRALTYWGDLISAGGSFVTSLVAQNASMEQLVIAYTGIMGSGGKAIQMLLQIRQFALETPFQFADLAQFGRLLLALGFNAQQVIPWLTTLGDTVSALGGSPELLQRLIWSIGQMQAAGKVRGTEMRELASAGIPAWQMLADYMGVTVPEAMKISETSTISASIGLAALQQGMDKMFGGMMQAQMRTFNGQVSNLADYWQRLRMIMMQPIFEAAKQALEALTNFLASPTAIQMATAIGNMLRGVMQWAINAAQSLVSFLFTVEDGTTRLQKAWSFLQVNLIQPIGRLLGEIGELISSFFQWGEATDSVTGGTNGLFTAIGQLIQATGWIINQLADFVHWLNSGTPAANMMRWAVLGLTVALLAMNYPILGIIAVIMIFNRILEHFGMTWETVWDRIAGVVLWVWNLIEPIIHAIMSFFEWVGGAIFGTPAPTVAAPTPVFGAGLAPATAATTLAATATPTTVAATPTTVNLMIDGRTLVTALGSSLGEFIRVELGGAR